MSSHVTNSAPVHSAAGKRPIEPMDPQVRNIQPGGGIVMRLELAWGRLRRAWLRSVRPGYVARMRAAREGQQGSCPFEPIDSRDVKYYRNQGTYRWPESADRFRWRDRLPFVRDGLAELLLIGGGLVLLTALVAWWWWPAALLPGVAAALVISFFRNPRRTIPSEPGLVVSPADGKVVSVRELEDPDLGPSVEIGIFLSIFNVHVNRAAVAGRVIGVSYRPGKCLNALRPESAKENERLEIRLEEAEAPYRMYRIRQITGAIARRIVCGVAPGDVLRRGETYGMIKLGSRTELVLPKEEGLRVEVLEGQNVRAGTSVMARYPGQPGEEQQGA